MGAYLGQTYKSTALSDSKLQSAAGGAGAGATVGSIFGPPGTAIGSAIGAVVGFFTGGSRSHCTAAKKQQEQQIAQAISTHLTESDRRDLVAGTESNIAPTPQAMAHFWIGGDDCYHKNVTPGDQRFRDRLPQVVAQRAKEAQQAKIQASKKESNKLQSSLPVNMQLSTYGIEPAAIYFLIGSGIVGLSTAGYFIYKKRKKTGK